MTSVSLLDFLLRGEDPPQEGPETAKEVEQEAVGGTGVHMIGQLFFFATFFPSKGRRNRGIRPAKETQVNNEIRAKLESCSCWVKPD